MLLIRILMQRQIRITVNRTARRIHQIVCTVINNLLVKNRVQNPNEFLTRQKLATLNRVTGVDNLCVLTCFGQLISDRDDRFGHSFSLTGATNEGHEYSHILRAMTSKKCEFFSPVQMNTWECVNKCNVSTS